MLENIAVSYIMPVAYVGLALAALSAIAFPLIQMLKNLRKAKTALIGVGIIVAVFFLCWFLAGNQDFTVGDTTVFGGQMRVVEASILTFYVLLLVSVIAILYSFVSRYFK